jgi:small-conductance mechanosensitive channel
MSLGVTCLDRFGRKRATLSVARSHSLSVSWRVGLEIAIPTLAAEAVRLGAQWGGLLAPAGDQIAQAAVGSIAWAAAVLALGRGLALARQPHHRLLNIGDKIANRARAALRVVAVVTAGGFFIERINYIVGASLAATIAANCIISLAYVAAAALALANFGRDDDLPLNRVADSAGVTRTPLWTLFSLTLGAAILTTVGAVLLGYTTLAALISGQIFWLGLLAAGAVLALRLVDDLFASLFHERGQAARALHQLFGLRSSVVLQVGLLMSAGLQVLIFLAVAMLALTPFGESGQLFIGHVRQLGSDIHLGKVTISPSGVAGGIVTLVVGIGLAHLARNWVVRRYLPVTHWDAGVSNSVSTGVTYVGIALAIAGALAVTGVGLQQIALVAGALSVGIGFGLQQIVQNFVAGIILLIERPVKVGDWVNVGGVEGDVLAIRVRATDIRSLDGSTIIVPNSNLITTNVQNKSSGAERARLLLEVTLGTSDDVPKTLALMLELLKARSDILQTPAPEVFVDGLVAGGGATLVASLYIADPRAGDRLKSEVYIAILTRLKQSSAEEANGGAVDEMRAFSS